MPLQEASCHHSQWRPVQKGYRFNAIFEIELATVATAAAPNISAD